jgi:hypothetical protein
MLLSHSRWCEARASVLAALEDRSRCVVVVGPSGTGKSILLRDIARTLAAAAATEVQNASGTANHPILVVGAGAHGTAVIDDGDRLSEAALAELMSGRAPQCVFAGSPDLANRLKRIAPNTRIVTLDALPPDEARAYLALWLKREKLPAKHFERPAEAELIAVAEGIPRALGRLAWRATQVAAAEDSGRIKLRHVREVASAPAEMLGPPLSAAPPDQWQRPWRRAPAVPVARIAAASGWALAVCLAVLTVPAPDLSRAVRTLVSAATAGPDMLRAATASMSARVAPVSDIKPAVRDVPAPIPTPPGAAAVPQPAKARVPEPRPAIAALHAPPAPAPIFAPTAKLEPLREITVPDRVVAAQAVQPDPSPPGSRAAAVSAPAPAPRAELPPQTAIVVAARELPVGSAERAALPPVMASRPAPAPTPPVPAPRAAPPPTAAMVAPAAQAPLAVKAANLASVPGRVVAIAEPPEPGPPGPGRRDPPPAPPPATPVASSVPPPVPIALNLAAAIPAPDLAPSAVSPAEPQPAPIPALLLIVRGGDTLGTLYEQVYRGVVPPAFEAVAAANPKHPRPGDVLTFPPPPGGWKKQRTAAAAIP